MPLSLKDAWEQLEETIESSNGCTNGFCVIKGKAKGLHTNGGCRCVTPANTCAHADNIRRLLIRFHGLRAAIKEEMENKKMIIRLVSILMISYLWFCLMTLVVKADVVFDPSEGFKVIETSQNNLKSYKKRHKQKSSVRTRKVVERKNIIQETVGRLVGLASYYWQPQPIACGRGRFNPNAMTAAHKTLPCGTIVKVTNRRNNKSVIVRINDRGPYIKGRIIDLSKAAAEKINMTQAGVVPVIVTVLK